ncbi:Mrp/NBP35 family ATP-binding protein [Natronobacterium gregoryi]|uniref:Iron-sulfur cluster carrier protein n=2 Tax=Natronobacterium gregoryi TaxID=44930 RepID=L0ACA1_NATGS|nr:P-loop NTPase [Natronobacterium gregoryi]AFZ71528.1 ATPase involved in chromosome partitioning [Natronobacterium gregoryi SP2]ELY66584.1 ParA/MinD ATPase-like protein [Natronobacterium gregoryi SP2]PLK21300.1 MRP family ATP-binding protein [Natronobacterium gregoryi SP2]SFI82757.1 ATP-binding protein involved in chromosome partitioning [Natronobacterium gregoryi]
MSITEHELKIKLEEVEDPDIGEDIVTLGLVNDVTIDDGTARISLALNAPYAPSEMELGNQVRELCDEVGLEADVRASVGREHGFDDEVLPNVRNVIAVSSGKGGVGKTTVAANLAAGLEKRGAMVGLLDADIHGPNVPKILPIEGEPGVMPNEDIVPPRSDGVRIISMGFMMEEDDDPAILRGPMVNKFMMKFLEGVEWGRLDYLIVDLPPGTGDATLNLLQSMPVTGSVVVTTPQEMALEDTSKGIQMFNKHDTPVLGVVENMSSFVCPSCDDQHGLFGTDGADEIVDRYDTPLLGKIPIHPDFGADGSKGPIVKDDESSVQDPVDDIVDEIADRVGKTNRRTVAENTSDEPADVLPTETED